jgi:serine O-acetyltransferase
MINAVKFYRVARWAKEHRIPLVPKCLYYAIYILYGAVVPVTAVIGRGSRFSHGGIGVVIHPRAVIGRNVLVGHGVTIGGNMDKGAPQIGDNVFIATGAKVLGAKVGNNVIIGANAVVLRDVPDSVVVGGVPGRVIRPVTTAELQFLQCAGQRSEIDPGPDMSPDN